jgi:hypothetical protein
MRTVVRSLALATVMLLVSGPLATLAVAQQPAQQPDLFQEAIKASSGTTESETLAYDVGAGAANVVFVPGKAITCAMGVVMGGGLLALTLGAAYKSATAVAREVCGGKWYLQGDDLKGTDSIPGSGERP